jgi:hypothetical protein
VVARLPPSLGGVNALCDSKRTSVIQLADAPEPLLSGRVPNLQSHSRAGVDILDLLGEKARADGRLGRWGCECILDVTMDQTRLADALRAEDHDFGLEAVRHTVYPKCAGCEGLEAVVSGEECVGKYVGDRCVFKMSLMLRPGLWARRRKIVARACSPSVAWREDCVRTRLGLARWCGKRSIKCLEEGRLDVTMASVNTVTT